MSPTNNNSVNMNELGSSIGNFASTNEDIYGDFKKASDAIYNDPNMTNEEKIQAIDQVYSSAVHKTEDAIEAANKALYAIKDSGNDEEIIALEDRLDDLRKCMCDLQPAFNQYMEALTSPPSNLPKNPFGM